MGQSRSHTTTNNQIKARNLGFSVLFYADNCVAEFSSWSFLPNRDEGNQNTGSRICEEEVIAINSLLIQSMAYKPFREDHKALVNCTGWTVLDIKSVFKIEYESWWMGGLYLQVFDSFGNLHLNVFQLCTTRCCPHTEMSYNCIQIKRNQAKHLSQWAAFLLYITFNWLSKQKKTVWQMSKYHSVHVSSLSGLPYICILHVYYTYCSYIDFSS